MPHPDVPEDTVAAAVAGQHAAVARVSELIHPVVLRYCRSRLGRSPGDVSPEDVAQETCLAVLTALPRYRQQGKPFLAFVHGIAAHKVSDAHRAAARGRVDPDADPPDLTDVDPGPEQCVLRSELADRLRAVLDHLPRRQREILVLRVALGLSAEETASIVGATPTAVRVNQHRALRRVRRILLSSPTRGR